MSFPVPLKPQLLHNFALPNLWSTHSRRSRRPLNRNFKTLRTMRNRYLDEQISKRTRLENYEEDKVVIHEANEKVNFEEKNNKVGDAENMVIPKMQNVVVEEYINMVPVEEVKAVEAPTKKKVILVKNEMKEIVSTEDDESCSIAKLWNLRPRQFKKYNKKNLSDNKTGGHERIGLKTSAKISIQLSKEEIEEDFYKMTKAKPSSRPKKRSKIIQKQVEKIIPGMFLPFVNPKSYEVHGTLRRV